MAQFYKMRDPQSHSVYITFIDTFAPCIVGKKIWNDPTFPMKRVAEGKLAFDNILTVSDEAFLVLCMRNYRERWLEEFFRKTRNTAAPMYARKPATTGVSHAIGIFL